MSKQQTFITTFDNPFDYFKQFDEWLNFDRAMGYNTLEMLARTCKTSYELSEADQDADFEDAFDRIIEWHEGIYKKIYGNSD